MASNAKKKWKSWLNIIKKYGFRICFPISETIPLFLSSHKIHAMKYIQAHNLYSVSFSCYFHFLLFVSKSNEILSQKFSITYRFTLLLNTEWKICYLLMKFEIQGLGLPIEYCQFFFCIVPCLQHSRLSRQTDVFFIEPINVWSKNMSSFDYSASMLSLNVKHRFWKRCAKFFKCALTF